MRVPDKLAVEKLKGYNDEMTISQVVLFFERQDIFFTKTMIQNYVRVEVLPPPEDKRYYTKKHLLLLYMIDELKNVFSLDEIKRLFSPVLSGFGNADMNLVYRCYAQFYESFLQDFEAGKDEMASDIESLTKDIEMQNFLLNLSLIAQSAAAKNLATGKFK